MSKTIKKYNSIPKAKTRKQIKLEKKIIALLQNKELGKFQSLLDSI